MVQANNQLIRDLEQRLRTTSLFEWIEERAEALAALDGTARRSLVDFCADLLEALRVVSIEPAALAVGQARTVACEGGFKILYKYDLPIQLRRFAIAHEIGHILWFAPGRGTQPLSPQQMTLGHDPTIELLCDRFAAALLLPRSRFRAWLEQTLNASPRASFLARLPDAAEEFCVYEQAVARRYFFELFPRSVAVVCVARSDRGTGAGRSWITRWCVLPSIMAARERLPGVKVPLKSARVLPPGMLPAEWSPRTRRCLVDGRWWRAIEPQPSMESSVPLGRLPPGREGEAFVSGWEDRFYIVLPVGPSHEAAP